ncbi:MAG: hypothetical protein IT275_12685 [Chitinophagales bacterium]|nr:hypothetical protein [Chitinophagales bacterium]
MAKQYRLREGDVIAVDTKTQLTTSGSDTAPGPLNGPSTMKFITALNVAAIQNMAAATSYSAFIRLEGPGLVNGPETFCIGAGGNDVATGGNAVVEITHIPVNLPITEANEIQVFAEMCGTDIGTLSVQVGIEFSDAAGEGAGEHKTLTVEGDVTAADTRTALLTQGSMTSPSLLVPAGYTKIDKVIVAAASEGLADGGCSFFIRLGGNAVKGGEQLLPVSCAGRIAPQAGSDAAPQTCYPRVLENLDIEVSPSDTVSVWAEMAGTDTGTGRVCATLIFAK